MHIDASLFWAIEETLAFFRSHERQASKKVAAALGISAASLRKLTYRFRQQLEAEDLTRLESLRRLRWQWVISKEQADAVTYSESGEQTLDKEIKRAEKLILNRLKIIRKRSI